ncbi:hypothetical protein PVL29_015605 [Vitis rotundifolia]|uniref:Uncharacterized protein n=1 Tax=Vitis rotundifolia TaxID=103349 RepID=A0AA39DJ62_VITRO|nr:hypothetical protein PVL29_015605 [Vitis rotundifolia]
MASFETVNVLERCQVAPPPVMVDEKSKSLPLTFFDMPWLHSHLMEILIFYAFPHPKTHFIETIIPNFKHSLSLALRHFYFLAGNLIFPPNFTKPEIRYKDGDSVSLIFAESTRDFNYLIGSHPRNVAEFHPLVPQLSPVSMSSSILAAPLLAIQVTLFPNFGISLGFTFPHSVADGNTFSQFLRLWASINKLGEETAMLQDRVLPFYDRTVVKDPLGIESIFWNQVGKIKFEGYRPRPSTNNVLATFVLSQEDLQRLKRWVAVKCPTLSHVSSFTVACAYVWACMAKARAKSGEDVGENEPEHLAFVGDCRAYFDPPIPANYFGNCLAPCSATVKSLELITEDGFIVAANTIGKAIQERLRNKEGIVKGLEKWMSNYKSLNPKRIFGVAGSPKFSCYDTDFGLGRPCKGEIISIDATKSISLNEGKNNKEDVEIGLSFPKIQMDVFTSIFVNDLKIYD